MSHLISTEKVRLSRQSSSGLGSGSDSARRHSPGVPSLQSRSDVARAPSYNEDEEFDADLYIKSEEMEKGLAKKSKMSLPPDETPSPGAVRISGIDGSGGADLISITEPPEDPRTQRPSQHELVDAMLVDRAAEEEEIRNQIKRENERNVPLAEAVKERPWYRRRWFYAIVVLIAIAAGATAGAVVATRGSDTVVVASMSPTSSPAPTALAFITAVVQFDSNPQETGWSLACGGETIVHAPPGSYAILQGARPRFRMEWGGIVTQGEECELVILDTAGNGIEDGFFAVYFGDDIGDQQARIRSGFINPSETKETFIVAPPVIDPSATPMPTAAPLPTNGSTPVCTVCPDGSRVPQPLAQADEWELSCADLEVFASNRNASECLDIQDSAAVDCGCTDFCSTICPDRLSEPPAASSDNLVLVSKTGQQVTCGDFQEDISNNRANSQEECLSAWFLGEDVCGCEQTDRFCRICQDESVPPPEALTRDIVPGFNCRDVTAIAYTLRAADPSTNFFVLCPACLAIGAYCGCPNPSVEEGGRPFCRLCGNNAALLPDPARLVNSTTLGLTTTCYHVEFASNINSTTTLECDAYRQDAAAACCSE